LLFKILIKVSSLFKFFLNSIVSTKT